MIPEEPESRLSLRHYTNLILGKLGVDSAVRWTLMTQCLRFVTGPITMVLMVKYLTPEIQGYVYTFAGVLGLSIFLEMGFSQNILQFASHEFSKLEFDSKKRLIGNPEALSRLISLARLSFKYYSIASAVFFLILIFGGKWFFDTSHADGVAWETPWILACLSAASGLLINPCWALLEGCNQIAAIERFRFYSSIITFILTSVAILSNFGLYAFTIPPLIGLLIAVFYLVIEWRSFFYIFTSTPSGPSISWRHEMWPFQWRIAISWACGYFIFSMITPVIFRIAGAPAAGRFGFTMQLVRMIATIASSWTTTKLPLFGILVAKSDWQKLNSLWRRVTITSLIVSILGSIGMVTSMEVAIKFFPNLESRYAGLEVALILCFGMFTTSLISSFAYYLRAFRTEPFMRLSIINAALSASLIPICTWLWGVMGASIAYTLSIFIMIIPAYRLFVIKRSEFTSCALIS